MPESTTNERLNKKYIQNQILSIKGEVLSTRRFLKTIVNATNVSEKIDARDMYATFGGLVPRVGGGERLQSPIGIFRV